MTGKENMHHHAHSLQTHGLNSKAQEVYDRLRLRSQPYGKEGRDRRPPSTLPPEDSTKNIETKMTTVHKLMFRVRLILGPKEKIRVYNMWYGV